jgi:hypothetical protein
MSSVGTLAMSIWLMASFDRRRRLPVRVAAHVDRAVGHLVAPRRRRHLAVPRGAHRGAVPARDRRHRSAPRREAVSRLAADAAGRRDGRFLSLDLFVFFIFFEIVLVPMYFLIGGWGYENREYAATKFFLYTMFGSAFMLVGLIATVAIASRRGLGYGSPSTSSRSPRRRLRGVDRTLAVLRFAIAFAVKVPIFPLHTWLPDAHTQAPTAGSVVLAGVMLKLGTYGLLRFGLYLFPEASYWSRNLWLTSR